MVNWGFVRVNALWESRMPLPPFTIWRKSGGFPKMSGNIFTAFAAFMNGVFVVTVVVVSCSPSRWSTSIRF
jgi:hypothetical protein